MKRKIQVIVLLSIMLALLAGCNQKGGEEEFMPTGDVGVTVQYLPEKVDNPEELPVLKWLCMTDFGQGGGKGRVWNETAVHQLNDMLKERNMPYRIQFIMLTNDSSPGYYEWLEQKEAKKLIKEADLVYGALTADEMVRYLMPITSYAAGQTQPSLENTVPYEGCWDATTVSGDIYGIKAVKPRTPTAIGWYVAKEIIDEYGLTVEDFAGKYYWEMDDVFAQLYEKNANLAFLAEETGGSIETVVAKEGSAKEFVPLAIYPLTNGRFQSIGAFYAMDYGQETPQIVNLLETEYVRSYQEAIIRYADAGYLSQNVSNELIVYGNIGTDTVCQDDLFYYIPVEPLYMSGSASGPTSGICATTKHPEEALSLLALIGNDEEFRMQLAYGKEGQDYTISDDGYYKIVKQDDKSTYSLDFLFCLNYFSGLTASDAGNDYMFTPTTRHNRDRIPEGKNLLQTYQERSENSILYYPYSSEPLAEDSKSNELSFHYRRVKKELKKIEEVSDYYFAFYSNPNEIKDNPNTEDEDESRPRMSKEKYDEMLQALRDAGSDKILAELQSQLDAWLAENPDWNRNEETGGRRMKTEKRLFTLCLVVLMSLPLFGCGEDQGTAQAPEASAPAWEDESSWVLAQTKPCALTDEGFYFASENGTLCFADTSNGISVCLCSKPGCLHNTEWCDAIVSSAPISRPMFFWNHHIFYVAEDEFGTHVYRRNADGTAKTMVADLGIRYIEERMSVDLYYFAQSGDYLYYDAVVYSTVLTEEEEEASVQEMTYIGRLNLKTNQEEIILESEHTLFLDAVCPEGILFSYCEDGDIDFEAENRKEQLDAAPAYVKFWNSKTGEVSTVLSRKNLDLTDVFSVRGSKLYYSRNGKQQGIWEYDMTTGNDRRVCGFNHDLQIDGRLVFKKIDGISTLFDLRTGKLLPTAFAGESLSVMTVSSDGVVLKRLLFEGGNTATSTTYCYVKLEDLADGLQKEDVLDLYTYLNEKPITSEEEMWDQYFGQDG